MVNTFKRWCTHTFIAPWRVRKLFPNTTLKAIETAIRQSEIRHSGELRFAIEKSLSTQQIRTGLSSRQRAVEVFSNLRVWDTEENSGVLIYLLLAERTVHIIADRGINKKVAQSEWDGIVQAMQQKYRQGDFQNGSITGIEQISALLTQHFPANPDNPNELPDAPVILS